MIPRPFREFFSWTDEHAVEGLTSEGKVAKYVPHSAQSGYWTPENIREILQSRNQIASANDVQDYICIFSILVYVEGDGVPALGYLGEIMRRGFDDASLPWHENLNGRHDIFGGTEEGRAALSKFIDTQWMFYPMPTQPFLTADPAMPSRVFMPNGRAKPMNDRLVSAKQIFPITEICDRPTDASRATRRVTVSYMQVHSPSSTQQSSPAPITVVFKSYPPEDEETYNDECRGYTAMRDATNNENILQCLGSFHYVNKTGQQFSTIMSELAHSGTLRDLFLGNEVPYLVEHVRAMWTSFLGILHGLAAMHNQIRPHGYLCFHQDLKPSNVFLFGSKDGSTPFSYEMKIGDFGSSYSRSANPAFQTQNIPDKGATRIYGPPETFLGDTCDFKPESSADIWAFGCILIEVAVWITGGRLALNDFRRKRMEETKFFIQHESLGRSDCFHDGNDVLNSVRGVVQTIDENCRPHDYITPAMVDLAINHVLIGKDERLHADQLIPKIHRILQEQPESYSSINCKITQQASWLASSSARRNLGLSLNHKPPFSDTNPWAADIQTLNQSSSSETSTSSSTLLPSPPPELSDSSQPKISTTEIPTNPGSFPAIQSEIPQEAPKAAMKSCRGVTIDELSEWFNARKSQNRERRCVDGLKSQLCNRDLVFMIDDSKSSKDHEKRVRETVAVLAYIIKRADLDGIDIAYASSPQPERPMEAKNDMSKFFKQLFTRRLVMDCMTEKRLKRVLDPIKTKWSQRRNGSMMHRRNYLFIPEIGQRYRNPQDVTVLFIPPGMCQAIPEGTHGSEEPFLRLIESKWKQGIPGSTRISTQFVPLNLDECGIHKLEVLDAKLKEPFIVVGTKPYDD